MIAIKIAGIKRVYYSDDNGNIIREKVQHMVSDHMSYSQQIYLNKGKSWHF